MKFINNTGNDRVIDSIQSWINKDSQLDVASAHYSLFAFAGLAPQVQQLSQVRLVVPASIVGVDALQLLGTDADIAARNQLQSHWLAKQFAEWLRSKAQVRQAKGSIPQGTLVLRGKGGTAEHAVLGAFAFSTDGLGLSPGNPLSLIQQSV